MAFLSNWIGSVLSPSIKNEEYARNDNLTSHRVISSTSEEAKQVEYRGRPLKDIPIAKLKRALAEDFNIATSDTALRVELMRLLARAIGGSRTSQLESQPLATLAIPSSKKRVRDQNEAPASSPQLGLGAGGNTAIVSCKGCTT